MPCRASYALFGALVALGAPFGLALVHGLRDRALAPAQVAAEMAGDPWTYVYVTVSTVLAFGLFGYVLGYRADRLYAVARTDPLTGLLNRRALEERLANEFLRAVRYGSPLSVMLIDVDELKKLNDRLGHRMGDAALRRVGAAIETGCRATDTGGRWGGDEFAILAPSTGRPEAVALAERIRALAARDASEPGSLALTISAGVATFDVRSRFETPEDLVRAADAALYAAKQAGRNRVSAA